MRVSFLGDGFPVPRCKLLFVLVGKGTLKG